MSMHPDKDMRALPAEAKLGGPKTPSAPPCYSDAGWLQRPDDEAYSFQFMRMLGAAQGAQAPSQNAFSDPCKGIVFDWPRRKLGSTERIVASVEDACDCAGA